MIGLILRIILQKIQRKLREDETDTLVQKVMKKVEQFMLWNLKNNKDGFEFAYGSANTEILCSKRRKRVDSFCTGKPLGVCGRAG